ncbi:hypothetical protein AJ88_42405 [Mesorhizobium amorphae CCBAU 01583]|nr:hypothetical protein AJ88_42405 [Mesorhizobium amorphae CCBAU 01583]
MMSQTEITPLVASPDRMLGFRTFWHYFSVNRGAVIGLFVFILLVLAAVLAPVLAPYAPDVQDKTAFLRPPAWQAGGSAQYLLGTDAVGRDMLSRLLYGPASRCSSVRSWSRCRCSAASHSACSPATSAAGSTSRSCA